MHNITYGLQVTAGQLMPSPLNQEWPVPIRLLNFVLLYRTFSQTDSFLSQNISLKPTEYGTVISAGDAKNSFPQEITGSRGNRKVKKKCQYSVIYVLGRRENFTSGYWQSLNSWEKKNIFLQDKHRLIIIKLKGE